MARFNNKVIRHTPFLFPKTRVFIWVFPKIGGPQNGWFIWKTLLKWMIWGYHYSRKHPYDDLCKRDNSWTLNRWPFVQTLGEGEWRSFAQTFIPRYKKVKTGLCRSAWDVMSIHEQYRWPILSTKWQPIWAPQPVKTRKCLTNDHLDHSPASVSFARLYLRSSRRWSSTWPVVVSLIEAFYVGPLDPWLGVGNFGGWFLCIYVYVYLYTVVYMYVYIYIYLCVCVCVRFSDICIYVYMLYPDVTFGIFMAKYGWNLYEKKHNWKVHIIDWG